VSLDKKGQHSIFDSFLETINSFSTDASVKWTLYVDGASRGNPGKGGAGVYLKKGNDSFLRTGFYLGNSSTNNEAEYCALLIGIYLFKQKKEEGDTLSIFSDSQLLIYQLLGKYRVKKEELQKYHRAIKRELEGTSHTFDHVMREKNTVADAMANKGIDEANALPLKFLDLLRTYNIFL
jgi:ribonuclease HI